MYVLRPYSLNVVEYTDGNKSIVLRHFVAVIVMGDNHVSNNMFQTVLDELLELCRFI